MWTFKFFIYFFLIELIYLGRCPFILEEYLWCRRPCRELMILSVSVQTDSGAWGGRRGSVGWVTLSVHCEPPSDWFEPSAETSYIMHKIKKSSHKTKLYYSAVMITLPNWRRDHWNRVSGLCLRQFLLLRRYKRNKKYNRMSTMAVLCFE